MASIPIASEGKTTISYYATDNATNRESPAQTFTVKLDKSAPAAPVITSPPNDSIDDDGNFIVSGTAEANSTVELFKGPASRGTATVNASGEWGKSLIGVAEGSHTYTARAKDATGNTSDPSDPLTVEVKIDATAPTVLSHTPTQTTAVPRNTRPTATFSADMDASTITPANVEFQVYNKKKKRWIAVAHTVSYDAGSRTATATPGSTLPPKSTG